MNNRIARVASKISITSKITLLYGSVFALTFILTSIFMMANATYYYRDVSEQEIITLADSICDEIASGKDVKSIADETRVSDKYTSFVITELEGESGRVRDVIFSSAVVMEVRAAELSLRGEPGPPPDRKPFTNRAGNTSYMSYNKMAEYNGNKYIVGILKHYAHEQRILKLMAMLFVATNIVGIICAFLIGRYISKVILRPVVKISQTAERISIEDLNQRIEISGPDDEVKRLAITFNDMINRLQVSFKKQSRFVSDASHELRTPISVIQGYANLIDRWGKSDPAILQESIDSIKAETEHMGMLVKKLLFLAQEQQNTKQMHMASLSLNLVAAEIVKEVSVMEISNSVTLVEESNEWIRGDYDLIKQMIWIFMENSFKYTKKEESSVVLKVFSKDGRASLSVLDDGIGIDEEDLPFIFERFYRADKSRSKEISGTGLGLSIADWIIRQHGGVATAKSVKGEGTEITVAFPKIEEESKQDDKKSNHGN